jgi:hypothetical protein
MSKSKKESPLQSLLSQWNQQQQPTAKSYNILLQHATGLVERTQAADAVANLHLYRRAKVRTPAENATRDIVGGYLWLQHLLELVVALPDVHVIYIPTTTTTLTTPSSPNLTILPTTKNPWGWEDDEPESPSVSFNDTPSLAKVLQDAMDKNTLSEKKTVVVWESLTPLLARHNGLISKTISFLRQFSSSSCLQVWPVRIDSVTKVQHAHLEDTASAVLWLQGGDMTLIRQGIRETGNIVRETLPFRIEYSSSSQSSGGKYRLLEVENENEEENQDETPQDQETPTLTPSTGTSATSTGETSAGTVKTRSRTKVRLQMEEEKLEAPPVPTENNRPRIFLQDDDPEFDDLDEEDPDDDLEI